MIYKFVIASILVFMLTGCDAGWWFNTNRVEESNVQRIEGPGFDMRVYTFRPEGHKNIFCITVKGDRAAGLQCLRDE